MVKLLRKIKLIFFSYSREDTKDVIDRRQKFYNQFISPNDLVFDVGANVGNRTKPLLNIGARVVAIEPQKKCCKILEKKFGNKIEIVPIGLGETEEIKDFFVANIHTSSSFSTEWIDVVKKERFKDFITWKKPIKIQITTLNKLIVRYGLPKFIKIDVEGYELEVLKGLTYAVDLISFEYIPEQIHKAIDCISQIEKYNSEIECNFSKGESMEFSLKNWQSATDFKNYILSQEFSSTIGWGDIYVRKIG